MKRGQTATEYIIIVAVVIIIAVVVANLLGFFPGIGTGTAKRTSDFGLSNSEIAIDKYKIGEEESVFLLRNNYFRELNLENFSVAGIPCDPAQDFPINLNIGQTVVVNCTAINSSNVSTKLTPSFEIAWSDPVTGQNYIISGDGVGTSGDDEGSGGSTPDTTPPASVTSLDNTSRGETWVYLTWTNPVDADFNEAIVYVDGSFETTTSNSYYNVTGLTAETSYEFTVHTNDTNGNLNDTDVNLTASTSTAAGPGSFACDQLSSTGNGAGLFYAGDGSSGSPYQICNCSMLEDVGQNINYNYILIDNIDCSSHGNFNPISTSSSRFTGDFNGNEKTISGLTVNLGVDGAGLFGGCGTNSNDGKIYDLSLVDVDVTGTQIVGGLVGHTEQCIIERVSVNGSVNGAGNVVGGLAGWDSSSASSIIRDCYVNVDLSVSGSYTQIGGVIGQMKGHVESTYFSGTINAPSSTNVGGLVGRTQSDATTVNSFSTGTISASSVGALIGQNDGSITNSHYLDQGIGCVVTGNSAGCNNQTAMSYFYDVDNAPMTSWSFPPWSNANDDSDLPILAR